MDETALVVVALVILGYGLFSERIRSTIISAPMIFVVAGWVIGAGALRVMDAHQGASAVHLFAEITLIIVLFTDAARVDLRALRRDLRIPARMLVVGMPLTIVAGALLASGLFPQFNIFEAALLAAILAPTDAALGQAVVSDPAVPGRVRRTLNVESGLNDGIALPVVLALAACAEAMGQDSLAPWFAFTGKQLIFGPLVGAAVGYLGGQAVHRATVAGWMNESFQLLSGLALAGLSYGAAELVHGNGFIAAFVGGLVMGHTVRGSCNAIYEFAEAEGQLLGLITFLLFGAVLLPPATAHWTTILFVYCLLSLTVVRMLPVSVSLIGVGLRPVTHLFLGWFGPRGLASILFGLLIVERMNIEHREEIMAIVVATVLLSVFAHGISAAPAARAYGRTMARCQTRGGGMPEHTQAAE